MKNIFENVQFIGCMNERYIDGDYKEVTQDEFDCICKYLDTVSKSILKSMEDECIKSRKSHKCNITPNIDILKNEVKKSGKCIIKSITITAMPEKQYTKDEKNIFSAIDGAAVSAIIKN